jgi:hypothetical protein
VAEEAALTAATPARRRKRAGRAPAHHGGAVRPRAAQGQGDDSRATEPVASAGRDAASQADATTRTGVGVLTEERTVTSEGTFPDPAPSTPAPGTWAPETPTAADWTDVIAERDSGAWRTMPADPPSRGTSARSPATAAEPALSWPDGADSGWFMPTGTSENADWMTGSRTSADAGRATGPGSGAHSEWRTGRRTGENAGWTTDPGAGWDTGAGSGRDTRATPGWRTEPEAGSLPGGMTSNGATPADAVVGQPEAPMVADPGEPAAQRKPAERHSHRAGRHGRPPRRPWGRQAKDKDGES